MTQATVQINGEVASVLLNPRNFITGSKGYQGFGKLDTGKDKYQLNVIAILIGSKPGAKIKGR